MICNRLPSFLSLPDSMNQDQLAPTSAWAYQIPGHNARRVRRLPDASLHSRAPMSSKPGGPRTPFFCPLSPSQLTDSVRLSRRRGFSPSFRGHIDIRNANPLDVSLFHAKGILPTCCLGGFNIVALVYRGKVYPLLMNPSPRVGVGISKNSSILGTTNPAAS